MLATRMVWWVMPTVLLSQQTSQLYLLPRPTMPLLGELFTLLEVLVMLLMDTTLVVLAMPMVTHMQDLLLTPTVPWSQLNLLTLLLHVLNILLLTLLPKNQIVIAKYLLQCCEFSSNQTNTNF